MFGMLHRSLALIFLVLFPVLGFCTEPEPWQFGFQDAATPVMEKVNELHTILLWVIFVIAVFVAALLLYTGWRFHEKRNPIPSKTTHNTLIEVIWTVIPVVILIFIGIPSLRLIYYMDKVDEPEITIKAIGHQWYWEYEYPEEDISFDSYMIKTADLKPGQKRLLEVDRPVVLPVNTNIRILTTSADVIHSFGVPAFGIKQDSVPGRLAEVWARITKTGNYYGQCYEICGMNHSFMPIQIKVVSREEYDQWIKEKGGKKAKADASKNNPTKL